MEENWHDLTSIADYDRGFRVRVCGNTGRVEHRTHGTAWKPGYPQKEPAIDTPIDNKINNLVDK